jgi:energy-coupling factor transporter ATP-binding protein EcfA2
MPSTPRPHVRPNLGASPQSVEACHRPLIELRSVVKTYSSTAGTFTALRGVDLQVDHGEFVAVVGKSGSGKTTLINMITGIDRPTSGEEIDVAAAEVRRAQAQLALLQAGTRPETIAVAESDVAVAKANLKQAQEALVQTELRAPFAGIVAAIVPTMHEFVASGSAFVRLADISAWEIETTDLSDLGVARVREGDPVEITFDGIPGLELTGRVMRIQGFGESKQGDIVYKVTIKPDRQDPRFRWNMTASVTITPQGAQR